MGQVLTKSKRFVTVEEYHKETGLSCSTIKYACESGQLKFIKTEKGHYRIDTQDFNSINAELMKKINTLEHILGAICKQFNIKYEGI